MAVLAIEMSTSSVKTMVFDRTRGVLKTEQRPYPASICREGTLDTEAAFQIAAELAKTTTEAASIDVVALCGTWHSLAVCDGQMRPVTPTFSWEYTATAGACREIRGDRELADTLYRRTGCMPHNTYLRHVIPHLRSQGMSLEDKNFITQGAYCFYRLTGVYGESVSTQCGTGFVNVHSLVYDEFILRWLRIREDQLAPLTDYRSPQPLSQEGARLLGIPAGTPVVPAYPDGALNQLGSNANRPGAMTLSVGTSGALRLAVDRPVLPKDNSLWCYYGVDRWVSGGATAGACNCLNWFRRNCCCPEGCSLAEMDKQVEQRRDLPVFLPFLYGERCPGWRDTNLAGFQEIAPRHDLVDLYGAIELGVLCNLYQCYDRLTNEVGQPDSIAVSGGIANSAQWLQMLADLFQHELLVTSEPNISTIGAAALGLYALGDIRGADALWSGMETRTVQPRSESAQYYRQQYERYLFYYEKGNL